MSENQGQGQGASGRRGESNDSKDGRSINYGFPCNTDEEYLNLAYQGWVTQGSGSWGDPRTFGLDVRYEY